MSNPVQEMAQDFNMDQYLSKPLSQNDRIEIPAGNYIMKKVSWKQDKTGDGKQFLEIKYKIMEVVPETKAALIATGMTDKDIQLLVGETVGQMFFVYKTGLIGLDSWKDQVLKTWNGDDFQNKDAVQVAELLEKTNNKLFVVTMAKRQDKNNPEKIYNDFKAVACYNQ